MTKLTFFLKGSQKCGIFLMSTKYFSGCQLSGRVSGQSLAECSGSPATEGLPALPAYCSLSSGLCGWGEQMFALLSMSVRAGSTLMSKSS